MQIVLKFLYNVAPPLNEEIRKMRYLIVSQLYLMKIDYITFLRHENMLWDEIKISRIRYVY